MILANRSGMMIATTLVRTTTTHHFLKHRDCKHQTKIDRLDPSKRLFNDVDEAMAWIESENKK